MSRKKGKKEVASQWKWDDEKTDVVLKALKSYKKAKVGQGNVKI